jgi:hypothetical protein
MIIWCPEPESNRHDRLGSRDFKHFTLTARILLSEGKPSGKDGKEGQKCTDLGRKFHSRPASILCAAHV